MTKYQEWVLQQNNEFIKLIHPEKISQGFKDQWLAGIDLKQLEELDNIFNNPEGNNDRTN